MLSGYINGCAIGFRRGHGLRFDERIVAKNDYDVCLMNAYLHRRCLKNCRYTFCQKNTFIGAGGQSAWRNSETEKNDVALLRAKYGQAIQAGGIQRHPQTRLRRRKQNRNALAVLKTDDFDVIS